MVWLGLQFDTLAMTVTMPLGILDEIMSLVGTWFHKTTILTVTFCQFYIPGNNPLLLSLPSGFRVGLVPAIMYFTSDNAVRVKWGHLINYSCEYVHPDLHPSCEAKGV